MIEASIEQSIANDAAWITKSRRQNQTSNFRQQSVAQFARLERVVLRSIEKDPALRQNAAYTFDTGGYSRSINCSTESGCHAASTPSRSSAAATAGSSTTNN